MTTDRILTSRYLAVVIAFVGGTALGVFNCVSIGGAAVIRTFGSSRLGLIVAFQCLCGRRSL